MPADPLTAPSPLEPGARVALISPAGALRGEEDVQRAVDNALSFGWEPVVGEHVLQRHGYMAGSDEQRLHDLNEALRDPAIDGVWCMRGGYGCLRLLPGIDFAALHDHPKPLIGYSDVTALHSAIQRHADLVSYHGPVARAEITDFTRSSLLRAVVEGGDPAGHAGASRTLREGRAEGILAGGNLAVLTALAGTPYAPDLSGCILVLEDIDEYTYRIDRMLRQLYLSGLLEGCRAIVFGECTNCPETTESGARTLDEVLGEMADLLHVPCLAGAPLGHIPDQWTLPLGAAAVLDTGAHALNVIT